MSVDPSELDIRELEKDEEFQQLADLQTTVWGFETADIAAPHLIMVHKHLGGVVLGAVEPTGRVVAFTYSFFGLHKGRPIQWSHMLAVLPEYRGSGIGKRLKWKQREKILERGVKICRWTFDPLEGLNARLNIFTLGAQACEYIVNAYGSSSGPLHSGLPTDRLVAHWDLECKRVSDCAAGKANHLHSEPEPLPSCIRLVEREGVVAPGGVEGSVAGEHLAVPIPPGIQDLKRRQPSTAEAWRRVTREVFQQRFAEGYILSDVLSPGEWGGAVFLFVLRRSGY